MAITEEDRARKSRREEAAERHDRQRRGIAEFAVRLSDTEVTGLGEALFRRLHQTRALISPYRRRTVALHPTPADCQRGKARCPPKSKSRVTKCGE